MRNDSLIVVLGALVALLLDVVISPNMPLFSATPNFMITYAIVIAMICKGDVAYLVAFVLGLVSDLLGYGPVGSLSLVMLLAVFAARHLVSRFGTGSFLSGLLTILLFILAVQILHALIMLALGAGVNPIEAIVYIAIPGSVLDCVLSIVIYPIMIRLLVPRKTTLGTEAPKSRKL